jgi:ADP-ribosyl-[dinitrogen reductase] hydrolase
MQPGRIPTGSFTDDTEMALALADSLLEAYPLDPANLARHFVAWYRTGPEDIGIQTAGVLRRIAAGEGWREASHGAQAIKPDSAGNGSVMRCWPVALAHHDDSEALIEASRLQSEVTHAHPECLAACAFINAAIYHLLREVSPDEAIKMALAEVAMPDGLRHAIKAAPGKAREELQNTGWVRHTVESAVWGLLTTETFEEAVVAVANLGGDTDTAASVAGALAGAAYGVQAIPARWREALCGRWPVRTGAAWQEADFTALADRLGNLRGQLRAG